MNKLMTRQLSISLNLPAYKNTGNEDEQSAEDTNDIAVSDEIDQNAENIARHEDCAIASGDETAKPTDGNISPVRKECTLVSDILL